MSVSTLNIRIAERGADAVIGDEQRIYTQIIKAGLRTLFTHPRFPVRFPSVRIEIQPVSDAAGLQVCDLMLWASQRATNRNDPALLDRLGLRELSQLNAQRGPTDSFFSIFYRFGLRGFELFSPEAFTASVSQGHETIRPGRMAAARTQIETLVETCMKRSKSNRSITHLRPALENLLLEDKTFDGIARAFLLICHTLPVYPKLVSRERAAALVEFAVQTLLKCQDR